MYIIAAYNGQPLNIAQIQYIPENLLSETKQQVEEITKAALEDYKSLFGFENISLKELDIIDKYFDKRKIKEIIKSSDPQDYANSYLISICEFGAVLGKLFSEIKGFDWLYSYPYFHSIIVHSETGYGITVFDWAVKKFSSYGLNDGFANKFNACLEVITEESQSNL